jgi:hypothetical protein
MRSEQAQIGARVRVGYSGVHSEWQGLTGSVSGKWGNLEYLALDVLLDDGRMQLFWHKLFGGSPPKSLCRKRRPSTGGALP